MRPPRPRSLWIVLIALALASGAGRAAARSAAPENDVAAAAIDRDCAATVDRALAGEPVAFTRIFGDSVRRQGQWHRADEAAMHRIAVDPNIYSEVAKAWTDGGNVVLVSIEARSLELRANSTYCFRPSGELARVMESSAGALVRDDETRYFDLAGRIVTSHSEFSSIYPNPGRTLSPDLRPSTPILYLSVRALPFYNLLGAGM